MPLDFSAKLDLLLRGQHILIRMGTAPADKARQLEHYMKLQNDIGPWLADYVSVMQVGDAGR